MRENKECCVREDFTILPFITISLILHKLIQYICNNVFVQKYTICFEQLHINIHINEDYFLNLFYNFNQTFNRNGPQ